MLLGFLAFLAGKYTDVTNADPTVVNAARVIVTMEAKVLLRIRSI